MLMDIMFFFFNDTATTEIYTLSLHDALPIFGLRVHGEVLQERPVDLEDVDREPPQVVQRRVPGADRKSTRLNSSHANISYAVFCLKKKKKYNFNTPKYTY